MSAPSTAAKAVDAAATAESVLPLSACEVRTDKNRGGRPLRASLRQRGPADLVRFPPGADTVTGDAGATGTALVEI